LKLLRAETAQDLAQAMAAVGLAQNLAAIRALATEGIQKGHMALHARQVAISAGAADFEVDQIAQKMVDEGIIRPDRAEVHLRSLRES
jgi:hydroxymethylglutaryl-CoA reductase